MRRLGDSEGSLDGVLDETLERSLLETVLLLETALLPDMVLLLVKEFLVRVVLEASLMRRVLLARVSLE